MASPELPAPAPDFPVATSGGAAAGGAEEVVYGLLTLAGVEVALPLAALREVVPCPAELADLPVSADGLLGAMTLRELVVPVVDLRPRLGVPAERSDEQVVVIIAQDDRVLGLLADGTRDVTHVALEDLRAVQADDGGLLFSHAFRHPALGCVVSVLHVGAVLGLPGVPTVHDPAGAAGGAPAVAGRRPGGRRTVTLLRCGDHVLGIEVAHVHTTLAAAFPEPSVLDSVLCRGVTDYRGKRIAVVDPLVLLGLGDLGEPADSSGAGLVLELGEGYVVLALSTLVDINEMAAEDILPLPAFSVRRPDLLAGIAEVEGVGQCLILDGEALLAEPDLESLAAMNTAAEAEAGATPGVGAGIASPVAAVTATAGSEAGSPGNGRVYLTYSVGQDVATSLEQIAEIVAFPATRTATDVGDAVLGVTVHRSAAVPVLCLPTLLGMPRLPVTSATCLLIVQVDDDHVGFAVEALRAIDPLRWEQRDRGDQDADASAPGGIPQLASWLHTGPLVSVGENTRLLPDLDLRAIARAVRAQMSGAPVAVLPGAGEELEAGAEAGAFPAGDDADPELPVAA